MDSQRRSKKKNKLSNEREGLLNQLGFVWNCRTDDNAKIGDKWLKRYQELKLYHKEHGVSLGSSFFDFLITFVPLISVGLYTF